jgi:hypothetical protein
MRTTLLSGVLVVGLACLAGSGTAAAQGERKLLLSFSQGNVTLIAKNVTLREILAEWTRQGGCQFVNADKIAGGVLAPLQFENEPELSVLSTLLAPVSGYIVGGRRAGTLGASQFEAVYIVASSHPTSSPYSGSNSGPIAAPLMNNVPDDEIAPVMPITPQGQQMQPSGPRPPGPSPMPGMGLPGSAGPGATMPGRSGAPGTTPPGTVGRGGGSGAATQS